MTEAGSNGATDSRIGELLRTAREAAGVSLSVMAERTHYSKPYLGLLETGKRPVSVEHLAAYADVLGLNVDRLAAVAAAPKRVDAASLTDLATILSATRRLEDSAGAVAVLPAVRCYRSLADSLTRAAELPLHSCAVGLTSEIAQYQGWLELATGSARAAEQSFERAISLARAADDPDRLAHGLSFKAYAALDAGCTKDAASLTEEALRDTRVHPLLRVYDWYQRARVHAASGEPYAAQQTLLVADRAAEAAVGEMPPSAGYWYTQGFWGLHRGRVLWLLGHQQSGAREIQNGLAVMPKEHREAEWAAKWVRMALGDYSSEFRT